VRSHHTRPRFLVTLLTLVGCAVAACASAQTEPSLLPPAPPLTAAGVSPPADYVIGPDDVLQVVFWREKEMSAEVVVRPDGQITLPLINDVHAAGLTPEELRVRVAEEASRFVADPTVAVVVKTINSRRVFITGQVANPGVYSITSPLTVVQLITIAGGVLEYAKEKEIRVMRVENGRTVAYRFNYRDVSRGRNLRQNIELKPGDTVVVP
jgi:polysaccharide biosynthesis/export protein